MSVVARSTEAGWSVVAGAAVLNLYSDRLVARDILMNLFDALMLSTHRILCIFSMNINTNK